MRNKLSEDNIKSNVVSAAKWSSITEITVKIITPVVNMILARVLAPSQFGVVATATMIVSFADMFTDAGFQKYLVQKEFDNENEKFDNANVAFWTNLFISILLFGIIGILKEQLAYLVGNPGLGNVILVASLQLIFTAFSSIQMALYRRNFDFKTLFIVRIVSAFMPVFITLPLAFMGFGYWSIIIGNIAMQLSNAIILTFKSKWRPKFYYSFQILKKMFSFSIWSLIEAISIWLTSWVDSFIIGSSLNQYHVGLYKTSTSMVNSLLVIITGSTTPVLFSTLSRLQDDKRKFDKIFLQFQRIVSIVVFPIGVGVYLYSDLATQLLLGNTWMEASNVIGIWALTSAPMIVFGNYCSELYRAKGMPKLSFLAQVLHLIVLIPACLISVQYGFWALIYTRSFVRFQFILVHFLIMKFIIKFPILSIFKNVKSTGIATISMGLLAILFRNMYTGLIWDFFSILICAIFYFIILIIFKDTRKDVQGLIKQLSKVSL